MAAQIITVLTALMTVCNGARNIPLVRLTTTTTPAPLPVPVTLTEAFPDSSPANEAPPPPSVACVDAENRESPLGRLRSAMQNPNYTKRNTGFEAFIVFFSDEHLSDEPSADERRLEYISGWDGTGTGVVLAESLAAIWVPSAQVRRARQHLSCAWIVIDAEDQAQPTIAAWISENVRRKGRVAADARLTSWMEWQDLEVALKRNDLELVAMPSLIDQLWSQEPELTLRRPDPSRIVANLHNKNFTGLTWLDKVTLLRNELRAASREPEYRVEAMIVTALDEVAWLLNVRGRDLPYAPLLKAFVLVNMKEVKIYTPPGKIAMPVREALSVYNCFVSNNCTRVLDYTLIYTELRGLTEDKILIPTESTFHRGASAAIVQSIPRIKRIFLTSPIMYLKAQKNEAEIMGMRKAHLHDAVAMSTLLSYLEGVYQTGLTELSVTKKVDVTRATQAGYVGLSMATKVAFGPSGSYQDYLPTMLTNQRVFSNSTLIIQSGGQYEEGTTIVTRTLHYGVPTQEMRLAYTTVLRSLAALATLQAPATLPAIAVDPVARAPLWANRQDYPHSTGHAVGAALNRREDPVVINYRHDANLYVLREGYFIFNEPAWYGSKFGVKLGNVLEVTSRPEGYLGFGESTLVPFEPKLINKNLLTEYEIKWLNSYNARVRTSVGPELQAQGLLDVFYWMRNKTVPIELPSKTKRPASSAPARTRHISILAHIVCTTTLFFVKVGFGSV